MDYVVKLAAVRETFAPPAGCACPRAGCTMSRGYVNHLGQLTATRASHDFSSAIRWVFDQGSFVIY
ncbi:hypothetical protein AcV5_005508 [Taiwanofungus camphoratus]|nr:hypothetical protein AcV5_005508 [Antrodia cinnamomea]KAI0948877.1 hypothetical protein AcV7_009506 [Antrodia cinnamomea]